MYLDIALAADGAGSHFPCEQVERNAWTAKVAFCHPTAFRVVGQGYWHGQTVVFVCAWVPPYH